MQSEGGICFVVDGWRLAVCDRTQRTRSRQSQEFHLKMVETPWLSRVRFDLIFLIEVVEEVVE